MAEQLAGDRASARRRIADKGAARERDEAAKPLAVYRGEELSRMRRTFLGPDEPYHALRRAFVLKESDGAGLRGLGPLSSIAGLGAPQRLGAQKMSPSGD
jgi:hypothetical protein